MRDEILKLVHDSPTGGHLGVAKTKARIQRSFYWVHCWRDVDLYCRQCLSCAQRKPPQKKMRAQLQQEISGCLLDRIAIDFMGPLPETLAHNSYIMVVTDYFSKYSEAYAISDITAEIAAQVLVAEFIAHWGVPRQIHTDQGSQFESDLFKEILRLLGVKKTRTTPYRPQSDGQVERLNRHIKSMLFHYLSEKQDNWDVFLGPIMMAYRASVHESTGFTPNMLMMGREIECPESVVFGTPAGEPRPVDDFVAVILDRLVDAHEAARKSLRKAAQYQKRSYDIGAQKPPVYERGDAVMLTVEAVKKGRNKKMSARWSGPYLVLGMVGPVTVRIKKGPRFPAKVVHVDRLKRFRGEVNAKWLKEVIPPSPAAAAVSNEVPSSSQGQAPETVVATEELRVPSPPPKPRNTRRHRRSPQRLGDWTQ